MLYKVRAKIIEERGYDKLEENEQTLTEIITYEYEEY